MEYTLLRIRALLVLFVALVVVGCVVVLVAFGLASFRFYALQQSLLSAIQDPRRPSARGSLTTSPCSGEGRRTRTPMGVGLLRRPFGGYTDGICTLFKRR